MKIYPNSLKIRWGQQHKLNTDWGLKLIPGTSRDAKKFIKNIKIKWMGGEGGGK